MARTYFALAVIALLAAYTYFLRLQAIDPAPQAPLAALPLDLHPYAGVEEPLDDRTIMALGADQTVFREYKGPSGRPVWLFLGYFGAPQENSQIHSPKHCYPGSGWNVVDESWLGVPFGGSEITAKGLVITDGKEQQCVVYWFHTNSGVITNEYALKWDQMKNALLRRSQKSTFIRVSTFIADRDDREAATEELRHFIESMSPHLIAALGDDAKKGNS